MESAQFQLAEVADHEENTTHIVADARKRNAVLLFPPDAQLPDGWQLPWIKAGWAVSNCASSDRIPAALHGPGACALTASPWAEVGKPSLSGTVARGLVPIVKSLNSAKRPVGNPALALVAPAGGIMRRADFLCRLSQLIGAPQSDSAVLMAVHVDQATALNTQLTRTAVFDLEERIAARLSSILDKPDVITIWLEFGFGILVQRTSYDEVRTLAEKICSSVSAKPFLIDGESRPLSVSVGLSLSPRASADDGGHRWFASAHAAQGIASRRGGSQFAGLLTREFEPIPAERVLIIGEWVEEAKTGNNVLIEYQPMMPLHSSAAELYSVHAKLRDLRAPMGGVYREDYRRVARDAGAMVMIDRLSLFHAFETLVQEKARGRSTQLLVPIELETLKDLAWRWFEAELRRRNDLVDRLIVEIEASPELLDKDIVKRIVRLRRLGVRVCLADPAPTLEHVELWSKLPADALRVQSPAVLMATSEDYARLTSAWRQKQRLLIVDAVEDTGLIARLTSLGIDHLRGHALASIGPRLDYDFTSTV